VGEKEKPPATIQNHQWKGCRIENTTADNTNKHRNTSIPYVIDENNKRKEEFSIFSSFIKIQNL